MNKKTKSLMLFSLHIPLLLLAVAIIGAAGWSYTQTQSLRGEVMGKETDNSGKGSSNKGKSEDRDNSGKGNAVDRSGSTLERVARNVDHAAFIEKEEGNLEVSEELAETADEIEVQGEETEDALEAINTKPRWQVLLFGTDYKNLGQLRSQVAHNENNIRKLTKNLTGVSDPAASDLVQAQITLLQTEQQNIKTILQQNESQFSILGWVFKFFQKYTANDGSTDETSETTDTSL
jgi:hypothetical protein